MTSGITKGVQASRKSENPWVGHRVRLIALSAALFAIAGSVAISFMVDCYLGHGAHITWEAKIAKRYRIVTRSIEHRPHFRSDHRPFGRFVQDWNFERDGVPEELFEFRATWRSDVDVPRAGLTLRTQNSGQAWIFVDGEWYDGGELKPGKRRVSVIWKDEFRERPAVSRDAREHTRLIVQLCRESTCDAIRATQTQLRYPWQTSRSWLWGSLIATIALLLLIAFGVRDAPTLRRRSSQGLLIAIMLLGVGLRSHDYATSPDVRETGDELFAAWNGWQLLESGETRGWSLWAPIYGSRVTHSVHRRFGDSWMMIQPYFEHPPLTHLLAGAAAHLGGADDWRHVRAKHTRLVPLILFIPSLLLLFLLVRRLWPLGYAAHFASFLYASLPILVMQQRVLKEEVLLVPLALAATYCAVRVGEGRRWLVGAGLCSGLCVLTKVTGFAFVPAIAFLIWVQHGWRAGTITLLIGAAASSLLLLYGALIDWNDFVFSTIQQGRRPAHHVQFLRFLDVAQINSAEIGRGWILFLWLASFASLGQLKARQHAPISTPLIFYWSAIGLGAGSWYYGWYTLPLFPFLCAGAGSFLYDLYQRPDVFRGALVTYSLVFYSLFFLESPDYTKYMGASGVIRHVITLTAGGFMGAYAIAQLWPTRFRWLGRIAVIVSLATVLYVAVVFASDYDTVFRHFREIDTDVYFQTG